MPRRRSYNDYDEEESQPRRCSARISTQQKDAKAALRYDAKYHPIDEITAPDRAHKRKVAHNLVVEPIEIEDSQSETESETYEDDASGAYRGTGTNGRKRRRTSSTVSRGRTGRPRGLRCSTRSDIDRISDDYEKAWQSSVAELTPLEAMNVQKSQYENAWAAFATQYNTAADMDHAEHEDDGAGLGELLSYFISSGNEHPDAVQPLPEQGGNLKLANGLTEAMFNFTQDSQRSDLNFQHRSPESIAESLEDELDGHGEDVEVYAPREVHTIQADRSFTPRAATPITTHPSQKEAPKSRASTFQIHEDNERSKWAQHNLVPRSIFLDHEKENEEVEEDDATVPNLTSPLSAQAQVSRHSPATVPQKSFEAPTLRQELEKRATPSRGKVIEGSDGDTITDSDEEGSDDDNDDDGEDGEDGSGSETEEQPGQGESRTDLIICGTMR